MNKKKSKLLLIALVVICIASLSLGTIAYFTAEDKAHNAISSGAVEIAVREWADEERTEEYPDEPITGVMPGTGVTKIVEVENTGGAGAWARIKADMSIELAEGVTAEVDISLIELDIATDKWTLKDGWYYYNEELESGDTTDPLFTMVTFSEKMGNDYMDCTVIIDITAQAVQSAHNGSTALEAAGWPAE